MSKIQMTYKDFISEIKKEVLSSRNSAIMSVNKELMILYWKIVKRILENIESSDWGSKIIPDLSKDLKLAFPDMK